MMPVRYHDNVMPNEDLVKYIKNSLATGRTEDIVRLLLSREGWAEKDINDAFNFINGASTTPASPTVSVKSSLPVVPPPAEMSSAKKRKITILIVALALVLLGSGTAFGYFYYVRSQLTPDQVLGKAFAAMQGVKTFSYSAVVTSTVQTGAAGSAPFMNEGLGNTVTVTATASGTVDVSNFPNIQQSSIFDFNLAPSAGGATTLGGTVESVLLGGVYYIKLDSFNLGAMGQGPNPFSAIIALFTNQWFKIDPTAITQTFFKSQADQLTKLQPQVQLSPDKIQQIKDLALKDQIVSVDQVLPDEEVGNQETYHYTLSLNKNNLDSFVESVYPIIYGEALTDEQVASSTAVLDGITYNDLEIWIGTKDFLIYKTLADVTVAPNQTGSDEVQFSESMGNYDQPFMITAPEGAKDVNQILGGLFSGLASSTVVSSPISAGGTISSSESFGRDAERLQDMRSAQSALELYYNKCGYYPGGIAIAACPIPPLKISTWSDLEESIKNSRLDISALPNDPTVGATYYYGTNADNTAYIIAAKLEDVTNPVFQSYEPPSLKGFEVGGLVSCVKPYYCLSL